MLGVFITHNTGLPWAPNAWRLWVDHIMKQKETFGFKKAALVHFNGALASGSSNFSFPQQEIQKLKGYFAKEAITESVVLQGKTYIVKQAEEQQVVAFNGSKYIIIGKTKTMYIIVLCQKRDKCNDAAVWIKRISSRLREKGF